MFIFYIMMFILIEQAMAKMACQFHNYIVKTLSFPIRSSSMSSIHKGAPKKLLKVERELCKLCKKK
jgi:hypothetical protein